MVRRIRIDQPEESRPHFSPNAFAADESEAAAALSDAGSTEEDSPTEDAGPILVVTEAFEAEHIRAVERQVQQALLTHPDVTFSSISVSQIEGAVCLRGRLEYVRTEPEVCEIVRKIARVETVWNELVIRRKNVSSSQE
jgi:osmotically-inducible protein OsmY